MSGIVKRPNLCWDDLHESWSDYQIEAMRRGICFGGKGGGGTNTVVQNSSPPAQFLNAYQNVVNQAQAQAGQPLNQYAGPLVAGFTPMQLSSFNEVNNAQGIADPYINAAAQMTAQGATPINPTQFTPSQVNQYLSPYLNTVAGGTLAQMENLNQQQNESVVGNAISSGAWGGDRASVAQAELANQQATAEAPTIAGIYNTGYTGALGEFNTQQQVGVGAQEATGWLGENAGYGLGNLGNEALSTSLTGAGAEQQYGALEQQLAQEQLNIPYEEFQAQQAFPYQSIGWEAGIAEGAGAGAGGTSSTQYPGPSPVSQVAGLGLTGLGLYGVGSSLGLGSLFGGAAGGDAVAGGMAGAADSAAGLLMARRGGRIQPRHYDSGGGIPGYGPSSDVSLAIVPNVATAVVPNAPAAPGGKGPPLAPGTQPQQDPLQGGIQTLDLASGISKLLRENSAPGSNRGGAIHYAPGGGVGGAVPPAIAGYSMAPGRGIPIPVLDVPAPGGAAPVNINPVSNFTPPAPNSAGYFQTNYPVLTGGTGAPSTTFIPGSGAPMPGPVPAIPNATAPMINPLTGAPARRGGRILHYDVGGTIPGMSPAAMSPGMAPARGIPVPVIASRTPIPAPSQGVRPLPTFGSQPAGALTMRAYGGRTHFDDGGVATVSPYGSSDTLGQPTNYGGNPIMQGLYQRFASMPAEKLQELAVRLPPSSPYGAAVQRALQMRQMNPQGGPQAQATFGSGPTGASAPSYAQTISNPFGGGMRRGGRAKFSGGGINLGDPITWLQLAGAPSTILSEQSGPVGEISQLADQGVAGYFGGPAAAMGAGSFDTALRGLYARGDLASGGALHFDDGGPLPYDPTLTDFGGDPGQAAIVGNAASAVGNAVGDAASAVGNYVSGAYAHLGDLPGAPPSAGTLTPQQKAAEPVFLNADQAPATVAQGTQAGVRANEPGFNLSPPSNVSVGTPLRTQPSVGAAPAPTPNLNWNDVAANAPSVPVAVPRPAPQPVYAAPQPTAAPVAAPAAALAPQSGYQPVPTPTRQPTMIDRAVNSPWLPVLAMGLGTLASRSPYPGVAIGEGGTQGVKTLFAQEESGQKQRSADDQAKKLDDEILRLQASNTTAAQRLQIEQENATTAQQRQKDEAAHNAATEAQGHYTWSAGMGPSADDPAKQVSGVYRMPARGDGEPVFFPGKTLTSKSDSSLTYVARVNSVATRLATTTMVGKPEAEIRAAAEAEVNAEAANPGGKGTSAAKTQPAAPSQLPPRPQSVPAGSMYSPSRNMWRTPDGHIFDGAGNQIS